MSTHIAQLIAIAVGSWIYALCIVCAGMSWVDAYGNNQRWIVVRAATVVPAFIPVPFAWCFGNKWLGIGCLAGAIIGFFSLYIPYHHYSRWFPQSWQYGRNGRRYY